MRKVKLCVHCGRRLGLGVVSRYGKLYCGTRCKNAHRAAILDQVKRRKAVASLFQLTLARRLPTAAWSGVSFLMMGRP